MQQLTRTQRYYQENKERFRQNKQRSRDRNRAHVRAQAAAGERRRYAQDPQARIRSSANARMSNVLRGKAGQKQTAAFEAAVGCSVAEFRSHLEALFVDGMSWENRGRHGWHIDHVIPISSFDLTDPSERARAYHFSNTQPLWADANRRKARSIPMDGRTLRRSADRRHPGRALDTIPKTSA